VVDSEVVPPKESPRRDQPTVIEGRIVEN
jgi:hypothetical protein